MAALLRDRRIHAGLLFFGLTVVGAVFAYWAMFTQFASYDDEGTLLVALKAFVAGDSLYSEIVTSYGPFYYGVFGAFFALTGRPVSTDASRLIVVAIWVTTSLVTGLGVRRLTGSLVLGAMAMAVAFSILNVLRSEPMHPVGLALLVFAAFVLVVAGWSQRRPMAWGAAAGALLAALALTKINLGLFAIAAVAVALVTTLDALRARGWLRWPVTLVFLALPLILMRPDLDSAWTRELALLLVCGMASILVAATPWHPGRPDEGLRPWAAGALLGGAALTTVVIAATVATGSSLGDIYESLVVKAQTQAAVFTFPLLLPDIAIFVAIGGLLTAVVATRLRGTSAARGPLPGLLRCAAGVGIWFGASGALPLLGLGGYFGRTAVPIALAWVAALPPAGVDESPRLRFVRLLLPCAAVAGTLQAYPVAGSQTFSAAFAFVPVGALCVLDGWRGLVAWSRTQSPVGRRLAAVAAGVAVLALTVSLVNPRLVRFATFDEQAFRDNDRLSFAAASRLRLPDPQAGELERIVRLIAQNGCTALVGLPSMNSFHLWSLVPAPEPLPPIWMTQYSDARQRRLVGELQRSPRPCVLRNAELEAFWLRGRPLPDKPLVHHIATEFVTAEMAGQYAFQLPARPRVAPRGTP